MRNPALHIKRSDLIKLLPDKQADDLLFKAVKYSIRNRVFITVKSSSKKKLDRILEVETFLVDQFNRVYMGIMVEKNMRTLTIHKNSKMYLTLKEVAAQAKEFCDLFQIPLEEGFKEYVRLGVKLLGRNYNLYRLKGNASRVVDYFRNLQVLKEDQKPVDTFAMYKTWLKVLEVYFHVQLDVYNEADKYVHFVYAREDADLIKANYTDWITAQFEKWSYLNSIPEFSQLHGDNAKLIYQKYMATSNKMYETKEEKQYFDNVKGEKKIILKKDEQKEKIQQARLHKGLEETGSTNNGE